MDGNGNIVRQGQIPYFEERPDLWMKLGRKPDGFWIQGGFNLTTHGLTMCEVIY